MTGVCVGSVLPSTDGVGVETVSEDSEEHALNRTRTTNAIPRRRVLVIVTGVIMSRVVVVPVVVP